VHGLATAAIVPVVLPVIASIVAVVVGGDHRAGAHGCRPGDRAGDDSGASHASWAEWHVILLR
jgi:hypothetical protein